MPTLTLGAHTIHYQLSGPAGQPVVTFLNGLTQNAMLWTSYAESLTQRGFRVLSYDMLGQGRSSKPVIDIPWRSHADVLAQLLDALGIERTHLASISFGGIIAQDFAIRHGDRLESLVLMSTFAELTPQLTLLGTVMVQGLTEVGLPYLQSMLYPMNMSSAWIQAHLTQIPAMKRAGYIGNDGYAMQNLMESFVDFTPLTPDLHRIEVPTLILNGEYDFFTPRECHELLRTHIRRSRLVIVQHAYHAFTLEYPAVTLRQLDHFFNRVVQGDWPGDQTVWVADDDPQSPTPYWPVLGDWNRAIQIQAPPPPTRSTPPTSPTRRKKAAR